METLNVGTLVVQLLVFPLLATVIPLGLWEFFKRVSS